MSSEAQATSDAVSSPTVTRDEAIEMLQLAIMFIKRGKTDVGINQLYFLIDNLEVATALEARSLAREYGVSEAFLYQ